MSLGNNTTAVNDNAGTSSTVVGTQRLDLLDNVHTLNDLTEDNMLSVQPGGDNSGNEELRTVGVGTSIGHRQQTGLVVLQDEVLIRELVAVDGLSTGTVTAGEVTTLEHELGDDTVEGRVGVAETLLASAESTEVGGGLGDNVVKKLENDATKGLAVS